MSSYLEWRSLAIIFMVINLMSPILDATNCRRDVKDMGWPEIFEKVESYITFITFYGGENCDCDFGPHLNRTKKDKTLIFHLGIECKKHTVVRIKNPSNVRRKNVVSYLEIAGPCEVDLAGIASYGDATDFRVHTIHPGAKMKTPNSTSDLRNLQRSISDIGTLTLHSSSQNGIPEIFVNYNWTYMAEILLSNLSIKSFPSTLRYSMPRLQSLQLSYNALEIPPDFPWDDQVLKLPRNLTRKPNFNKQYQEHSNIEPNLYRRFLELDFNKIQDLSRYEFRGYLQKLSIKGNGLKAIGRNCLVNLTGINAIDLSINNLNVLPKGLFRGLIDLFDLSLNHNNISFITDGTFKDSTRLKTLYLNNNRLKIIPKGLLLDHEELGKLHLENNLLIRVEYGALPNNSNKLKTLYMNHNQLQAVPQEVFLTRSLEKVYLANNKITMEGIMETLDSIYIARLGTALRKSVSSMSLEFKTDSIYLDLTQNNIKSIDINGFNIEQRLKLVMVLIVFEINLKNNPLLCDCKAFNLTGMIKKIVRTYSQVTERRFSSWICSEPDELKGKPILTIPEEKFVCVRNLSGCPEEGTCSVRETDGSILVNIRNKNIKKLPLTMPQGARLELFFENNQIVELGMRHYLDKVTILHLSRNKIQNIHDSFIPRLTKIKVLKIDSNELKRLPRSVEWLTSRKSFVTLAIHSNYFICDCHAKWMQTWLTNSSDKIYDIDNVKCASGTFQGKSIYRVPLKGFTCEENKGHPGGNNIQVFISITLAVLLAITILVLVLVYFFRGEMKVFLYTHFNWHPFDRIDDSDPEKIYDAFISFSSHDREWVVEELQHRLENNEPPYRVCYHDRDFEVGATIQENIINSVNRSKRMIMVLSNNFIESEWCMLEFRAAHHKVLEDKTNYLIIILFQGVDTNALDDETKLYLRTNTYLSVTNKWFWQKLLYSLPKPRSEPQVTLQESHNLCVPRSSDVSLEIEGNVKTEKRENRTHRTAESQF